MAHTQDLPETAVRYRFRKECATIRDWLDAIRPEARVLDLGCGAGAWAERFAERFGGVVAIEQSAAMLAVARTRLASRSNVELLNQDVRDPLPSGPFDLVFVGGLCMYLSDADTIALLRAVAERLSVRGRVVLRESTVASGSERTEGDYRAIYRSVDVYRALFRDAGVSRVDVRRNYGVHLHGDRRRTRGDATPAPALATSYVTVSRRAHMVVAASYFACVLWPSPPSIRLAWSTLAEAPESFLSPARRQLIHAVGDSRRST